MPDAPAPPAGLEVRPGTYVLWLRLAHSRRIRIGSLGDCRFAPGSYAYVGSAFGPGGVAARVGRHLRAEKRRRWHIDYLRIAADVQGVWTGYAGRQCEHRWASILAGLPGAEIPVRRFGATDCACPGHLIWFARPPALDEFLALSACPVYLVNNINRFCD
jgi:Uri superfamily endonuclease